MEDTVNILKKIKSTSSLNEKEQILKYNSHNELLKTVLKNTFNPNLIFGISTKKLNKLINSNNFVALNNINEVFEYLKINNTGRDIDILSVQNFLDNQIREHKEILSQIITKDLKIGLTAKTICKVYGKGFIPEWNIQQAHPIDKYKLKKNEWICLGLKLNGIRATYHDDKFKSRQNKVMNGFSHIIKDIESIWQLKDYVIDGELVRKNIDNVSDNENFRLTTSIVNSDKEEKQEIEFIIFDIVPKKEFAKGESSKSFKDRLLQLEDLQTCINDRCLENIRIFPKYYEGTDHSKIELWLDIVDHAGLEGLMLLRNETYKCKRHNGILKVKSFKSSDCKIIGYEEGTGKYKGMLGSFVIDFKGNSVNVGSGFTDEQRNLYWNNKENFIGKILEVKYKEESKDSKTGLVSLQFPTFVTIRTDKSKPSYE